MKANKKVSILLSLVLIGGCSSEGASTEAAEKLTAVEVTVAASSSIKKEMTYAGQVAAAETVNVISRITGKVLETYYDVGEQVSQDDILFKLDEKDLNDQMRQINAQIGQADAGIQTAQNAVNSATGGQYQSQILQQETAIEGYQKQIDSAKIQMDNGALALAGAKDALDSTETSFNNIKTLYEAGLAAKNDFDQMEQGYNQALKGHEQAQNAYELAKVGYEQAILAKEKAEEGLELTTTTITDDNRRQAELSVNSAMASKNVLLVQKQLLEETLADTTVKAPISGVVSFRTANANEYTSNQAPAYVIVNLDTVNVEVRVSELLINTISVGDEVEVYIHSIGSESFTGRIKTISPAADQTSTFPVKIEIDNSKGELRPGMFAEVRFIKEQSINTIVVPRNTVLAGEDQSYVFIANGDSANKVIVETGIDNGKEIEIISGIDTGDRIVTKGQNFLTDSEKINIVTVWGD